MIPMRDTHEETTQSPEEEMQALLDEFKPRLVAALQKLGLDISDDITDEELQQVLNDEETFKSKLPEGTDLESLASNPALEEFGEIAMEFATKAMEIAFGGLFG